MSSELFDRFTGLSTARRSLQDAWSQASFGTAAIVDSGKNVACVRRALSELGVRIVADERDAEVKIIGTLSPGPLLDAWERRVALGNAGRLVSAWNELLEPVAVNDQRALGSSLSLSRASERDGTMCDRISVHAAI